MKSSSDWVVSREAWLEWSVHEQGMPWVRFTDQPDTITVIKLAEDQVSKPVFWDLVKRQLEALRGSGQLGTMSGDPKLDEAQTIELLARLLVFPDETSRHTGIPTLQKRAS